MYKFVLEDEVWWLEIDTEDNFLEYVQELIPERCFDIFLDFWRAKNYKDKYNLSPFFEYSKNKLNIIDSVYVDVNYSILLQQLDVLKQTGALFFNDKGGYHGGRKNKERYDDCIFKFELEFPKEDEMEEEERYGWLSPLGSFMRGEWGNHSAVATDIIDRKDWYNEYKEYDKLENRHRYSSEGDFLTYEKGYVLIHNPSDYCIRVEKPNRLTKKQKEFLYDYFMQLHMETEAKEYLEEI